MDHDHYSNGAPYYHLQTADANFLNPSTDWQTQSDQHSYNTYPRPSISSRSVMVHGEDIMWSNHNHMTSMERFLIDSEQPGYPHREQRQPVDVHHPYGNHSYASFHYNPQTQFPVPPDYRRGLSPGATSSSRSQSLTPNDEAMQLNLVQHPYRYESPTQASFTVSYPHDGRIPKETLLHGGGSGGVALTEIQGVPDLVPDLQHDDPTRDDYVTEVATPPFIKMDADICCVDDDTVMTGDAYHPKHGWSLSRIPDDASDTDYKPSKRGHAKQGRKRARSPHKTASTPRRSAKKHKLSARPVAADPTSSHRGRAGKRGVDDAPVATGATKNDDGSPLFPCPLAVYGCNATFSSKNEWKRHVSTQHVRLGFWRCDLCLPLHDAKKSDVYYNDFNRKDLFTQHLRRMHFAEVTKRGANTSPSSKTPPTSKASPVSETNVAEHQDRCYKRLRAAPPTSSCLFCPRDFSGNNTWNERMEHVGRHLEKDSKGTIKPAEWREDNTLRSWLLKEGLIEKVGSNAWKLGDGVPRRDVDNLASSDEETDDADGECEEDD